MRYIQDIIDSVTLNKPWLLHVAHDILDISNRIREIDDGYFIVYNRKRDKFEVHNAFTRRSNTYEFTVQNDALDKRVLDYCIMTLKENQLKMIAEMEKHNEKIDKDKKSKANNELNAIAMDLATDLRRAI